MNNFRQSPAPQEHAGAGRVAAVASLLAGAGAKLMNSARAMRAERARRAADSEAWAVARTDPRMMSELMAAACRDEGESTSR